MTASPIQFIEASRTMPLMELPLRTTVVQLDRARVLLAPASTLDDHHLRAAGAVTDIVCPNLLHLEGARQARRAFPDAHLWGPKGAAEKVSDVRWDGVLGVDAWPHDAELSLVVLEGMPRVVESVFFHHASRTLFVTDLAFNIQNPSGFGAWLILSLFGTHGRFAVSRLFTRMARDRAAFQRSLERVFAFDFAAVAPSHGAVVTADGKERLRLALKERGFEVGGAA